MPDVTNVLTEPPAPVVEAKPKAPPAPDNAAEFEAMKVKLTAMEAKAAELEKHKNYTSILLQGDQANPQQREEAMRYVLAKEGYMPEQIEQYVAEALNPDPTSHTAPNVTEGGKETLLEQRLAAMEERSQADKVTALKRELGAQVKGVLDTNPEMTVLLGKIEELRGKDGLAEARKHLAEELKNKTIQNMKMRAALTGQVVSEEWVEEEAAKAAGAVYKGYLSVIGDPNKIKRAPETVTGIDILLKKPPVKAPNYEPGETFAKVQTKSRDWATDLLSRAAAELGGDGESKA